MAFTHRTIPPSEVYQCQKCQKTFKGYAGGQVCPFCGHKYVTWLTFETDWVYDEEKKQWARRP